MKRFFMYLMTYVLITFSTAFGVVLITRPANASNTIVDVGGGENQQTSPFTHIINNFTSLEGMNINADVNLKTNGKDINLNANMILNMENGLSQIAVGGDIKLKINNSELDVNMQFINGELYFNLLNGSYKIETSNLMTSITQIMNLLNVEMPDLGIDLENFDVMSLLTLFDDIKETKTQTDTTLEINVPKIGIIKIVCDLNYSIKSINIPTTTVLGTTISVNASVSYPDEFIVEKPENESVIDLTHLFNLAEGLINFVQNNKIGLNIDLNYNNLNFSGILSCDLTNYNAKFETLLNNKLLNVFAINNVLYLEYGNLFAQFNLNQVSEITDLLEKQFNVIVPIDKISELLIGISQNNIDLSKLQLNSLDLSNIDLSILENFKYENNKYSFTIKNIGEFNFEFENHAFKNITFEGMGITAQIDSTTPQNIVLNKTEETYVDLANTIPTINAVLNTLKFKHHEGNILVNYKNQTIIFDYEINVKDGVQAKINTNLFNIPINITIINDNIYISVSDVNIMCSANDIPLIKEFITSKLNVELPELNKQDIISIVNDILDNATPLISKLIKSENALSIELLTKTNIKISHTETLNNIGITYENLNVEISINSNNEASNILIDESKFLSTKELLTLLENLLDYVNNKNFIFDVNLKLDDYEINGFVQYENLGTDYLNNIKAHLETQILNKNISIKLLNKTVYLKIDGMNLKFDLNNVNKVSEFIKNNFGTEIDELINNITSSIKNLNIDEILENTTLSLTKETLALAKNDLLININFEDFNLSSIVAKYNNLEFYATTTTENKDIVLNDEYLNIMDLLPLTQSILNTINAGKMEGAINLIVNNQSFLINYKIAISPTLQVWLQTKFMGVNIKINYYNEYILISVDNINLKAHITEIEKVITFINETFNTNITKQSFNELVSTINLNDILNNFHLSDIKNVYATKTAFGADVLGCNINLQFNEHLNNLTLRYNNIYANLSFINVGNNVAMPSIDISAYENIDYILNAVKNVYNSLKSKELGVSGILNFGATTLPINAEINFNSGIKLKLATTFYEKDVEVKLINNNIYATIDGLNVKYDLKNIDKLLGLLNSNFNLDVNLNPSQLNVTDTLNKLSINKIDKLKTKNGYTLLIKLSLDKNNVTVNLSFSNFDELINIGLNYNNQLSCEFEPIFGIKTDITVNEKDYQTDLDDLTTLLAPIKNLINSSALEINGELKVDLFGNMEEVTIKNLKVNFADLENVKISAELEFYGINVKFVLNNNVIYASIDELNIYIQTTEISDFIEWINENFNTDINLNDSLNIDFKQIIKQITFGNLIKRIYKTPNGLMIELRDYVNSNGSSTPQDIVLSFDDKLKNIILNNKSIYANLNFIAYNNEVNFNSINPQNYVHYSELTNLISDTVNYIKSKQYNITAEANIYNGNNLKYNANAHLNIDVTNKLLLNGSAKLTGEQNVAFDLNYWNEYLYVNYNELKLKICENDLKELMVIILNLVGVDPKLIPFLTEAADNLENIDFGSISNLIPDLDFGNPLSLLTMLSGLSYENDELKIVIDGSQISKNPNAKEMTLVLSTANNKLSALTLNNIFTGVTENEYFNLEINFNEFSAVEEVNDIDYIDLSGSNELIKALINTAELNYFEINGSLDINGTLISKDIIWNVPLNIKVRLDENRTPEVIAQIGAIPVIPIVNNDVPYVFNDTISGGIYSGLNRMLTVYYKDGDIYFYRREEVPRFLAANRIYEKKLKVPLTDVLSDPLKYLQYAVGFTDTIMDAIKKSLDLSIGHTPNLGNIINYFTATNSTNFKLQLNMHEITNDPKMGDMTIGLGVVNNESTNNKNYLGNATFNMFMPLADIFQLTLQSNDLTLINIGKELNFNNLYNYISSYSYNEGAQWEASNGDWQKASEVLYHMYFEENGGSAVSDITAAPSSTITLPTYSPIIIDDGTRKITRTFMGWYTTETCEDGTEFNSNVMPRKDTMLFAKWIEDILYYRTISFKTYSNDVINNITTLEGQNINLPVLTEKQETVGNVTTTYAFGGWFTDEQFKFEFNSSTMPNKDTTLYAKWNVTKVEETRLLQVFDNSELVYSRYIKTNDEIDINSIPNISNTTKFYTDANYSNLYNGNFTMPNENLNLHIRNKYVVDVVSEYGNSGTTTFELYQGEKLSLPQQSTYVVDDGTQTVETTYTFNGYSEILNVMPNTNKTITANWTVSSKYYYTVTFDLKLRYIPNSCADGAKYRNAPAPISSIRILEGNTLDLTNYQPTCKVWATAIPWGVNYSYKATGWGTSVPKDYSNGGGQTSITITNNTTLYPYWKKI